MMVIHIIISCGQTNTKYYNTDTIHSSCGDIYKLLCLLVARVSSDSVDAGTEREDHPILSGKTTHQ